MDKNKKIQVRTKVEMAKYIEVLMKKKKVTKNDLGAKLFEEEKQKGKPRKKNIYPYQNNVTKVNRTLKKCDIDDLSVIAKVLNVDLETIVLKGEHEINKSITPMEFINLGEAEQERYLRFLELSQQ